ncbi:hypothetical protein ACJMK2_033726 [Sinanodonta woodiana]|uniref:SOCS box domain-containing protein n=1 Tax=Sinanodonta woodiana TaxID=1069815 RepID=A0ABD3WP89_SINWO
MSSDKYPLHTSAREGDVRTVQRLIMEGYSVNKGTFDLVTPLHEACFKGSLGCISVLLEAGAEVNARNIDGATPLCDACSNGNPECVRLLLQHGADTNPPLLLTSPLHEAVLRDKWQCAEVLIEAGCKINQHDCHFGTPLHVAAYKGFIKSAAVLLNAGATVNATKIHNTALHDVARLQDCDFICLLLEHGADVYARDNHGNQAKDLIPSSTSLSRQLLLHEECTPRCLRSICRLKIRRIFGPSRLRNIKDLQLPKLLLDYLSFDIR